MARREAVLASQADRVRIDQRKSLFHAGQCEFLLQVFRPYYLCGG